MILQRQNIERARNEASRLAQPRLFDWLVVGLIFTYVWRLQDLYPILASVKFPVIVSVAALAVLFFDGHTAQLTPAFRSPIVKVATFILVWMALSVPTSVFPGLSFRFIATDHIKTFLMMLIVIVSIRGFADVERLVLALLAGAGLYAFLVLTRFEVGANGRLGDLLFYDANDLGMLLVTTLPFAIYFLSGRGKAWQKGLALACAGVFVVAIVRTGSRGAFLGLIAVAAYLVFAFRTIPARIRLGAVVGCTLLFLAVSGPQYWRMMETLLHPSSDYNWAGNNDVGRMAIWQRGIGYMANRPILGVGANAFSVAEGTISPVAGRQQLGLGLKWSTAHNSFVQIGAELGFPGLIAFLLLLWHGFRTSARLGTASQDNEPEFRRRRAFGQAVVASLIGYVVAGFFLSQAYAAFLYALLGIVAGLAKASGIAGKAKVHGRVRPIPSRSPIAGNRPAPPPLIGFGVPGDHRVQGP